MSRPEPVIIPPLPVIVIPDPIDPIRKGFVPEYSAVAERRRMEAAGKKFLEDFLRGRVHSPKMEILLWALIYTTLEACKLWYRYMVILSNGPPGSGSSTLQLTMNPPERPRSFMMYSREERERYYLEEEARTILELCREGERSIVFLRQHIAYHDPRITGLRRAIDAAMDVAGSLNALRRAPAREVPGRIAQLEELRRKLVSALEKIRLIVREIETKLGMSPGEAVGMRIPLVAGGIELQPGVWGVLDPDLRARLNRERDGLGDLFNDALMNGTIPVYGEGASGVKMKDPPEIKVRRDRLEAYQQAGTMRIAGRVEWRELPDGRRIKVIVFDTVYYAH